LYDREQYLSFIGSVTIAELRVKFFNKNACYCAAKRAKKEFVMEGSIGRKIGLTTWKFDRLVPGVTIL
jgi:hypothetical protein